MVVGIFIGRWWLRDSSDRVAHHIMDSLIEVSEQVLDHGRQLDLLITVLELVAESNQHVHFLLPRIRA